MTVSTTTAEAAFEGNGVTTVFPLGFEVTAATDLVLTLTTTTGAIETLVLNVDYTVSGLQNEAGATVTLTTPLATGENLSVKRATPRIQPSTFLPASGFSPTALGQALDRLMLILQEIGALNDRTLKAPVGEVLNDLPIATDRLNRIMGFDGAGQPVTVEGLALTLVTDYWANVLSVTESAFAARQDLFALAYIRNATVPNIDTIGNVGTDTASGLYATAGTTTTLPAGEDGIGGHVLAMRYNNDINYGAQLYFSPSGKIYRRGQLGGVFAAWAEITAPPADAVPLARVVISNQLNVDFTAFDNSLFDGYYFDLHNVRPVTNTSSVVMRASTNGGSTYLSGGTDYNHIGRSATQAGSPTITESGGTGSSFPISYGGMLNTGAGTCGRLDIFGPHLTRATGLTFNGVVQGSSALYRVEVAGNCIAGINAVRFLASSGNLDSGIITMYGKRKA